MKYFDLFHILPIEIVKIIINFIKINSIKSIIYFKRQKSMKQNILSELINTLIWYDYGFINSQTINKINILINNNWYNYNRYFWCCLSELISNKIMKYRIFIERLNDEYYKKFQKKNLKKITKLWFQLCKKYNLVLKITFYNFKSRQAMPTIVLPARNYIKSINNFYNILYTPIVMFNIKNNYYTISEDKMLNTLLKYII